MLPTRAWEFLLGTLLALRFFPSLHNTRICHLFSIVGFGLILIAVFMFSSTTKYPSYYALLPVFGTALPLYESNNKKVFKIFNQLKKEGLVDEILPLHQQFFEGDKTIMEENNHLLYRDDDHLSYWGSMKVRKLFAKYMKND
jgi:hypothetical protein